MIIPDPDYDFDERELSGFLRHLGAAWMDLRLAQPGPNAESETSPDPHR